jgi:hypothetical protein
MATPEELINEGDGLQPQHGRSDLSVILGGQALKSPTELEPAQLAYVPYDGNSLLINESNWGHMGYDQLKSVREELTLVLRNILERRHAAENSQHWEELLVLELDLNTVASKITWINGMLSNGRQ